MSSRKKKVNLKPGAVEMLAKFRPYRHKPRVRGFEHLISLTTRELQERLRFVEGQIGTLRGTHLDAGLPPDELLRLGELPPQERQRAQDRAVEEATALRNELRRRIAFRPG